MLASGKHQRSKKGEAKMESVDKYDLIIPFPKDSMWDDIDNDPAARPSSNLADWTQYYDEDDDKFFYIDNNAPHYTLENDDNVYDMWGWSARIWYEDDADTWHNSIAAHKCFSSQEALDTLIENYF